MNTSSIPYERKNAVPGFCYECEYKTLWHYIEDQEYYSVLGFRIPFTRLSVDPYFECKTCGKQYSIEETIRNWARTIQKSTRYYMNGKMEYLDFYEKLEAFVETIDPISEINRGEIGFYLTYDKPVNDELNSMTEERDRETPGYQ